MSISLADDIRIITSFPPNVSTAYGELWKSKNPDSEFLTLNKNTVASIDEIARGNTRGFDGSWLHHLKLLTLKSKWCVS